MGLSGSWNKSRELAEGEVPASAAEVLTEAHVPHGDHHGHDAACKQPQEPPGLVLVGRQESPEGLDAVVADHRVGGESKTQARQ